MNDEKRILLRLLKLKGNDRVLKMIGFKISKNDYSTLFDIIDKTFKWYDEFEGYKFFYYLQLDLICLLCEYSLQERYVQYYKCLIQGYGKKAFYEEEYYKWHVVMFNTYYKMYYGNL